MALWDRKRQAWLLLRTIEGITICFYFSKRFAKCAVALNMKRRGTVIVVILLFVVMWFAVTTGVPHTLKELGEGALLGAAATIVGVFARFGRVGFFRKFPFIRFRFVFPSSGDSADMSSDQPN